MVNLSTVDLRNEIFVLYTRIVRLGTYEKSPYSFPDEQSILKTSISFIKTHANDFNTKYSALIESNQTIRNFLHTLNQTLDEPYALYTVESIDNFDEFVRNAKRQIIESFNQDINSIVFDDIRKFFDNIDNEIFVIKGSLNTFNRLSSEFESKMFQLFNIRRRGFWNLIYVSFITSKGEKVNTQLFEEFDKIERSNLQLATLPETNIVWTFKNSKTNQAIQIQLSLRNYLFI